MLSRQTKEEEETADNGSEAGEPAALGPSEPTMDRGGAQRGADGTAGLTVASRLGWIRPPVGRNDGGGHRLREPG